MLSAIIQARMGSSRLPGKVLSPVNGRPLLHYLIERLDYVPEIEQVIVATTTNCKDDTLEDFCEKRGLLCYRGSESDVLSRIYKAASLFKADPVIRLTGDCPLLDTDTLSQQIGFFLKYKPDYCYLGLSFAEGICSDIFTFTALKESYACATAPSDREHVTPYFHKNKDRYHTIELNNNTNDCRYRFVVDQPEDLEVVTQVIKTLYRENSPPFNAKQIKHFLDMNPEIRNVNSSIIRNKHYDVFKVGSKSKKKALYKVTKS
jgi:spore coat polysaccharide biosynthesis protein SpsF